MKKKILMVIPNLWAGGAERQFLLNYSYLDRNKFDIFICLFNACGEFSQYLPPRRIFDLKKKSRFDYIALIHRMSNVIKQVNPDVVYSRLQYANVISSMALKKASTKKPIFHIMNEESILSKGLAGNFTGVIAKILVKKFYPHATAIIAPCNASKEDLVNNFKILKNKITIIYNSIDSNYIEDKSLEYIVPPLQLEMPAIIAVANLRKPKAHEYLLEAIKLINGKMRCNLWLIGNGPRKTHLQVMAKHLGVEDLVLFCGFQDNPYKFMKRAQVFALPSLFEGIPTAILESMALGVPVVATYVGGIPEIIQHNTNGLLVPPEDPPALSEAIIRLLTDAKCRNTIIQNAKKKIQHKFEIKHNIKHLQTMLLRAN